MAFKYVWKKESMEGRLLDPDDVIENAGSFRSYPRFNSYSGHETEDDAVRAYNEAIECLPSYYCDELILVKIFSK